MNSQTKFGRFHLEHVQGQQYMRCLKMQQNVSKCVLMLHMWYCVVSYIKMCFNVVLCHILKFVLILDMGHL